MTFGFLYTKVCIALSAEEGNVKFFGMGYMMMTMQKNREKKLACKITCYAASYTVNLFF